MSTNLENFIQALNGPFGTQAILTDSVDTWIYSYDNSGLQMLPAAVVFATDLAQIQAIVRLCRQFKVPLTCRGAGTATTGSATPCKNGVVLSLERMNQLRIMDPENRVMVVEPGMTNQAVQEIAKSTGFFWPPDPGSAPSCTVGGNLACNAAGPRALKYGAARDNTLGLKVVTGEGDVLHTGAYTTKSAVGYDLTRLLIGSEGTLGIIAEATLKLTPLAEAKATLSVIYDSIVTAATAVAQIMAQPITPCALEFMDEQALKLLNQHTQFNFPQEAKALLLIEVDGTAHCLEKDCRAIEKAAHLPGLIELRTTKNLEESNKLWQARKALSPALKTIAPKKINEDIVVPVSKIPNFIQHVDKLSHQYKIMIVNFGHAGNGNIHVNLLINPENPGELNRANACLEEIFEYVLTLNGTLSGEHGIGLFKKPFIERAIDANSLRLMQKIKQQFDPDNILNPGKVFNPVKG
jgi:D-lactate dehydrogenase (quinone)